MSPPAVVYVVAAVVGVAAVFAFKEFVYEPHLAPALEAWAEDFLERRRAGRNRRASAVAVRSSRRRSSLPPSVSSSHHGEGGRAHSSNNLPIDGVELEALASREVDDWRNEVLRSQEITDDGLRKRKANRLGDEFDGFESMSTTLDDSFTMLTHTPLASTHIISNVSSPLTHSTVSLPRAPTHRPRSESQSTTLSPFIAPHSPPSPIHEMTVMSPRAVSPGLVSLTPRPPTNVDTFLSPISIPIANHLSPAVDGAHHPLSFNPSYQVVADDSPFGPLLPDTPRSSAEMYGERPFSPITRVMGSSSGHASAASSNGSLSSPNSTRTLGSSGVVRKRSGLGNEVTMNGSGDDSDDESHPHTCASTLTSPDAATNGSIISSLSERYPTAPTPPVIVSPPVSSIGIISAPSSPRSGSSEEVVVVSEPNATSPSLPRTLTSPPSLELPPDSSPSPRLGSRRSSALSYASFLSPTPAVGRVVASESEGDEFQSVAGDDGDYWNASRVAPGGRTGPVSDLAHNPFFDFEHLTRRAGSEHGGNGSEGSDVFVADFGQEGASEVGSEESWGSARRH